VSQKKRRDVLTDAIIGDSAFFRAVFDIRYNFA